MSERDIGRFVTIRPGALGDTLLVFPALAFLRRAYPGAHTTLVARRNVLPLARAWGLADVVSPYDAPEWSALFAASPPTDSPLRSMLAGSTAIAWLADADGFVAANLHALGADPVVIAPGRPREDIPTHAALQLTAALAGLGVPVPADAAFYDALPPPRSLLDGTVGRITQSSADPQSAPSSARSARVPAETQRARREGGTACSQAKGGQADFVANGQAPPEAQLALKRRMDDPGAVSTAGPAHHVALHAGSGGATKRWPPERFAALVAEIVRLGLRPMLVEGPQDGDITHAVLAETQRLSGIEPAVARGLDLVDLARLLLGCAAYAGNDSGVSHLAGLLGLPTLALFGPTDPAIWSPLGLHVHILRSPTASLADLPVPAVSAALRDLLGTL